MSVDARLIDALGPPPPYRPIVEGVPIFERGPAPDLEPWREASLTRVSATEDADKQDPAPGDADPSEDIWVLNREAERADARAPPEETRVEPLPDFGPRDRPIATPRKAGASRLGLRARPRPRAIRPMIWAAGIGALVLTAGIAFDVGRVPVMRAFPGTTRIYTALGLVGRRSAARAPVAPASVAPTPTCVETRPPDSAEPPDRRDTICGDAQPEASSK